MAETTNQELKELILGMEQRFDRRLAEMDKRMEVGFLEVKGEITRVETELKGEITRVETGLKGEIKYIDTKLETIDKRLVGEETVTRTVFLGLVAAILTGGVKYFFFPGPPPG